MTTVVTWVLVVLLALLLLVAVLVHSNSISPLRVAAYRLFRFIPTSVCLWLSAGSFTTAMAIMSCTRTWLIDGTVQQWAVHASGLVFWALLCVPACRWLVVRDRKNDKIKRLAGRPTFQVSFERITAREAGVHVRRTDGRGAMFRQKLPEGWSNAPLVLGTIRRLGPQLWACGVRSIRVTSPDITANLLEEAAQRERLLRRFQWETAEDESLGRAKRVVIKWLRAVEPESASESWWAYARRKVLAAFTAGGWQASWRRLADSWKNSADPMVLRGVVLFLPAPSENRSGPTRCERRVPSTPDP